MAFDQNSTPKNLRPLNIVRNLPEDPRIAPVTSSIRPIEGFYTHTPTDIGAVPAVYYQTTAPAFSNGVSGWVPHIVPPQPQPQPQQGLVGPTVVSSASGYTYSPSFGSDESGGDTSASVRKIKFLCSFGGKILPRVSDGALRYVGGHTRIISVRRDIPFVEFLHKMADTLGQSAVIKYQLPDEDLDALVSVSCPDDLENMMDEYEKLLERSSDGSAKMRILLFSPSEIENASFEDLEDGGNRYVEAVNGIMDGFNRLARKESIESGNSARSSDLSGTEGADSLGQVSGGFSPKGISVVPLETAPKVVYVDPSTMPYVAPTTIGVVSEQDLGLPSASFPVSSPYTHTQTIQESPNHGNYVQFPSQMGFPSHILGHMQPIYAQQPIHVGVGVSPHQFSPASHMTPNPSFISTNHSNAVPAFVQQSPQHVRMEQHYPVESIIGQRVVPTTVQSGMYSWQPTIRHPEQVAFTEGGLPVTPISPDTFPEKKNPRLEDCYMCQKALPHAHSDTVVAHEKNGSPVGPTTVSDSRSIYCSLPSDVRVVPTIKPLVTTEGNNGDYDSGKIHTEATGVQQFPYGVYVANAPPQSSQHNNTTQNPLAQPLQNTEYAVRESPKEYSVKAPIEDSTSSAYDNLRQIDGRLENLRIRPSELLSSNEHNSLSTDGSGVNSVYSGVGPARGAERIVPTNEWKDNNIGSSVSPPYSILDTIDESASLFVNQDPWNMHPDTHFPPPKPSKIQMRRDASGEHHQLNSGESNRDFSPDHSLSNKDSADELIKQELKAVAEDVAASVLGSPVDVQTANVATQQTDSFGEFKTKLSEKINFGFPASGIGQLQIIKNGDLEELRELGSGTFGTVYHGKWRGTDVAIKRINDRCFAGKPSEQDRMRDDFWNEAIKLADLHHPNVVAFYGIVLDGPDGSIATVTEYMVNGSLRNALQKNERSLDKRKRLLIGMDAAFGMEYLHGKNIVHFDLKSDNLLVNLRDPHRPICKVGDLGLSKVKCHTLISGGVRGTLPWMAPELLNGSSSLVSEKVDVFSFGIVMWELLTGEEPYADLHYGAIIGGIVSNTLRPPVPEQCDPEWRDLMERCWSAEPSERPNFTQIADELRAMATKLPVKGQAQQQLPSANLHVKS
ncbi:hypothetical protein ABFS82_11G038500 [Erythranthe guttata]|uniref:uncharacterized protein LOC105960647 isoform X1 n=1 Tax=Erythranthe guttata TaxID=4155 RepID=UPI00064D79ED|nr:PREDICTED: uncharacterized protein LOC105960647 isoform X1 [Erythranthe guttata]|eukprot:XP_012840287.1 PREDICTED: uncharacterized protein LOC105960647 isoform X1 [Erythranthe guttata]